jgi:hypothetical protein
MPGYPCCCKACEVLVDDFNRSDSTNIGGAWVEHSGDWEIDTNELAEDGTTGLIYTTKRIAENRRRVFVTCKDVQNGKIFRLAAAVANNGESYIFIELAVAGGSGTLTLATSAYAEGTWTDSADIDTFSLGALNLGTDYTLQACLTKEGIYGGLIEISGPVWDCTAFNGPRAGIANAGGAAEYDDFHWYRHAKDILPDVDGNCILCDCECDGHCLPRTLTLTLHSSCAHRDGLTVTLNRNVALYPAFVWDGTGSWPQVCSPGQNSQVFFRLFCFEDHPDCPDGFALCSDNFCAGASTCDWAFSSITCASPPTFEGGECSVSHVCSPLEIVFRETLSTCSEPCSPCACTEWFEVTE